MCVCVCVALQVSGGVFKFTVLAICRRVVHRNCEELGSSIYGCHLMATVTGEEWHLRPAVAHSNYDRTDVV